jgi:two-component system nitrogen regulation response regulator NtrX
VRLPDGDGLDLLSSLAQGGLPMPVVMMSGHATIDDAVRATQLGARDFLEKPISQDRLLLTIGNVLELRRLEQENERLREEARVAGDDEMLGRSTVMQALMAQAERVAASEGRVLVTGENGTGKELLARAIHRSSMRKDRPFVSLNCAAVPGELIESELFGHEKGAFTGAIKQKVGKFERAHRGTSVPRRGRRHAAGDAGQAPARAADRRARACGRQRDHPRGRAGAVGDQQRPARRDRGRALP